MFPNGDGEMYYPDAVYRLWDAIQERMLKYLELPKITVHEIRHSYATALLRMGRAVYEVQDRLGHSTSAITQDLYAHVTPRSSRNLAESFAQALRNIDGGSDAVGPVGPLGASHDHSQTLE